MDPAAALIEIEQLAEKLAVEIRYDRFTGEGVRSGGICKIKGKWRVIIERRSSPTERLSVLARALSRFDLEAHFVSPALRSLIERHVNAGNGEQVAAAEVSPPAQEQAPPAATPKGEKPRGRMLRLFRAKGAMARRAMAMVSPRGRTLNSRYRRG